MVGASPAPGVLSRPVRIGAQASSAQVHRLHHDMVSRFCAAVADRWASGQGESSPGARRRLKVVR
jgi:hypothetical protein